MMATKSILPQGKFFWVMAGGGGFLAILGIVVALGPVRNRFVDLDESIVARQKQLGDNLAILAQGPREAVEKDFARYGNVIRKKGSSEEEHSRMLAEVDGLARSCKVVLTSTTPLEVQKNTDYEVYGVKVEVEADLAALVSFLHGIESSVQLLRIDQLSLESRSGKTAGSHRGTISISKAVTL